MDQSGIKKGEFNSPEGITYDNNFLYICDYNNNRIQILTKSGKFFTLWGGEDKDDGKKSPFRFPYAIYHYFIEDVICIGDNDTVQIWTKDGVCLQRLGEAITGTTYPFSCVYGMCIMNNRLYITDGENHRIQIFEPE